MANPGNQIISFTNGSKYDPDWLNRILFKLFPPGVADGLTPSIVNNGDAVEWSSGEAVIHDSSSGQSPHIGVRDSHTVTADPNAPYFVLGWEYDASADTEEDNTAYWDTKTAGDIKDHEIKLGKASFDANDDVTSVSTSTKNPDDRDVVYGGGGLIPTGGLEFADLINKPLVGEISYDAGSNEYPGGSGSGLHADLLDGFHAQGIIDASGGSGGGATFIGFRTIRQVASDQQTKFTVNDFDVAREDLFVTSSGVFMAEGASADYQLNHETGVVNNSSGNDDTYTVRTPKVSYDSNANETDIPVLEDIPDSTADGDITINNSTFTIVGVDKNDDIFTVSGDAEGTVNDSEVVFNSGREKDERVVINVFGTFDADDKFRVKVSDNDANPGFLEDKIEGGTVKNEGGNEKIVVRSPGKTLNGEKIIVEGSGKFTKTGTLSITNLGEVPDDAYALMLTFNMQLYENSNANECWVRPDGEPDWYRLHDNTYQNGGRDHGMSYNNSLWVPVGIGGSMQWRLGMDGSGNSDNQYGTLKLEGYRI